MSKEGAEMKLKYIVEHIRYLYKKIFEWYPYTRIVFPLTIILGVILPLFSSAIISIVVKMITLHTEMYKFIAIVIGAISIEIILKIINDLSDKWLERFILWSLNKSSCLKKPVFMRVSAISISLLITN